MVRSLNQITDGLHGQVARSKLIGTTFELPRDSLRVLDVFLVLHLVLKAGPRVHGNRAQLDLDKVGSLVISQTVWVGGSHFENQMVGTVAIGFDLTDIVFLFKNMDGG